VPAERKVGKALDGLAEVVGLVFVLVGMQLALQFVGMR